MALSFKEKRELQKTVQAKVAELKSGNLSFKEKRAAQKELQAAFARLNVKLDNQPEVQNEKLAALIAGKYNGKPPLDFLVVLKEIIDEIGAVDPVKPPVIQYVEARAEV